MDAAALWECAQRVNAVEKTKSEAYSSTVIDNSHNNNFLKPLGQASALRSQPKVDSAVASLGSCWLLRSACFFFLQSQPTINVQRLKEGKD